MFYRYHWGDCPEFSAENAWSALWGLTRSEDGSRTECPSCDGQGCEDCGGEGWVDALRGYSACESAEELLAYFAKRGAPDDAGNVFVFEGVRVGNGFDGEALVVPTTIVRRMSWDAFVNRS